MAKMMKKSRNPFYVLLVLVGTLFAITAFAFGIMTLHELQISTEEIMQEAEHPLLAWLRAYGDTAMLVELGLLAVLTFAAIGTDESWERRTNNDQ